MVEFQLHGPESHDNLLADFPFVNQTAVQKAVQAGSSRIKPNHQANTHLYPVLHALKTAG